VDPRILYSATGGEILPNQRNLSAGNENHSLGDNVNLADESRGLGRLFRADDSEAKPGKGLLSKFRKNKSAGAQVTQVANKSLSKQDRALAAKLAEIDRLRDKAVQTGDVALLNKADKLEKAVRSAKAAQR
jgi:hypothetical protein